MLDLGRLRDLMEAGLLSPTTSRGKYVHWDKLRHYKPPAGFALEEWWGAMKMARSSTFRPLPLKDKSGGPFFVGSPDELQRRTSEIDRDFSGRMTFPEELRNAATRDRYMVSALIEEAITSSQLEGAATTTPVAREMLRSRRKPGTSGERMIWNNFQAMEFVREHQQEALTPELVCAIHSVVTEGSLPESESGVLRVTDDIVVRYTDETVVHEPPPHDQLEARMEAMCRFANETEPGFYLHPVVRAILLHFWLGYDHPFSDGNGRTARALTYWSLLHSGYWLSQYVSISQVLRKAPARYTTAYLHSETDGNDATYFVLYQLEVIQRGITALHEYVREKAEAMARTRRLIHRSKDFNHRQLALLGHALGNPDATYTVRSHANSHRVTRQTARTDLNALAEGGYLEAMPAGRGKRYQPAPDLEARLRGSGHKA